jgi:glycine/D-amino acid oxidase-like deaminating enzyme
MNAKTQHIAIVGAGIVGSSIAFHLARRGAKITLIDAGEPGKSTTSVSFAWMNARDKDPRHYHDLNRQSLDMWSRFVRRLDVVESVTWGGELRWAATEEGAREIFERVGVLQSWGYPIRLLNGEGLQLLEPRLNPGSVAVASYTDVDGHVDTGAVVSACVEKVKQLGSDIRNHTRVVGLSRSGGQIVGVVTDREEIACDAVVLAGGPDTAELAAMVDLNVPMYHTFGCTVLTEPIPYVFENVSVVHSPRDCPPQTNFRQLPNGSMMLHGGAHGRVFDGGSLGQTEDEVQQVVDAVARFLPVVEGVPIREVRRGRRPIPKDGHPILGFTEKIPNLYLSVMHSGVTLAPLIGECAAIEILDGVRVGFLERYRLERFG